MTVPYNAHQSQSRSSWSAQGVGKSVVCSTRRPSDAATEVRLGRRGPPQEGAELGSSGLVKGGGFRAERKGIFNDDDRTRGVDETQQLPVQSTFDVGLTVKVYRHKAEINGRRIPPVLDNQSIDVFRVTSSAAAEMLERRCKLLYLWTLWQGYGPAQHALYSAVQ